VDSGKRRSIHPKSPVVSTVFSPAMKRLLFYLSRRITGSVSGRLWPALASGLVVFVYADGDVRAIGRERVGRHFEVVGRGFVAEHASGQVEGGAMAGAYKAAWPVTGQAWLRAGCERRRGRAAQVRADADADEEFGL